MLGISSRCKGFIYNGTINIKTIESYDIVASPAFDAVFDVDEIRKQEIIEKNNIRKKKLDTLW